VERFPHCVQLLKPGSWTRGVDFGMSVKRVPSVTGVWSHQWHRRFSHYLSGALYTLKVNYAINRCKFTNIWYICMRISDLCKEPVCDLPDYFLHVWMALVWDSRILCDKAIYAFNRYAINRFRLYMFLWPILTAVFFWSKAISAQ